MMKLKIFIFICLFSCLGTSSLLAHEGRSSNPVEQCVPKEKTERTNLLIQNWMRNDKTPDRVSFPTRTGFVLLRKKDIAFIKFDSKSGDLLLKYRKEGQLKEVKCKLNLMDAFAKLETFPFVKVSRSTIVNMNEVDQLQGTRRDAHLLMNDGSKIKISRRMTGNVYDWMRRF